MALFDLRDPAALRLRESAVRGTLPHALLLTGGGDRASLARFAAAALECEGEGARPCGVCRACHKVAEDIHPDVLTVRDDEHKTVAVEVIRRVRSDAYIRPNEGRRKVYLFPDCALLTEQDQNVLLKLVEEGPPYAAFIFCAENGSAVLQTLRSRCVELKLRPGPDGPEDAPDARENAERLCRAVGTGRRGSVAELAVRLERSRPDRDALAAMLSHGRELFAAALVLQYGGRTAEADREIAGILAKNLTKTQIVSTIELLEKYHGELVYYVGAGHVLGALAAELEGIL